MKNGKQFSAFWHQARCKSIYGSLITEFPTGGMGHLSIDVDMNNSAI